MWVLSGSPQYLTISDFMRLAATADHQMHPLFSLGVAKWRYFNYIIPSLFISWNISIKRNYLINYLVTCGQSF